MARFSSAKNIKLASRCSLFDLPLPLPSDSLYREMDLEPSATAEEVGWAVKILNDKRQAAKSQLDDDIKATVARVPGLSAIYDELSGASGASTGNERKLQKLSELENRALDIDPGFKEKQRKSKELAEKIDALNALDLGKLAGLAKYDEMHPPYILMKLAPAVRDEFLDQPRTLLWLLRREISRFLENRGEPSAYLNDLDRQDFTADFCPNQILDGDI